MIEFWKSREKLIIVSNKFRQFNLIFKVNQINHIIWILKYKILVQYKHQNTKKNKNKIVITWCMIDWLYGHTSHEHLFLFKYSTSILLWTWIYRLILSVSKFIALRSVTKFTPTDSFSSLRSVASISLLLLLWHVSWILLSIHLLNFDKFI